MTGAALACGSSAETSSDGGYPILPTDELVQIGQPLYEQNCASCHGDATTRPPVPFAPPHTDDGHTWHHPDRNLVDWILDGVPLATAMPEFRGQLTEQEVRAVVAYIKTFWPERIQEQHIEVSRRYEEAFDSQ
jgi:mono/diheme cytochrome c family protein